MLRELMNSTGITITNVFLQNREALHYTRLTENVSTTQLNESPFSLSQIVSLINQQVMVMSCLDMFQVVGFTGLFFLFFSLWQRQLFNPANY